MLRRIARFYRYSFYRVYDWQSRRRSANDAVFTALGILVITISSNIFLAMYLLPRAVQIMGPISSATGRAFGLLFSVPVYALLYAMWIKNNAYLAFSDEFANESRSERLRGKLAVYTYFSLSVLIPLALAAARGIWGVHVLPWIP